ncbi:MAG: hypothetical protein ACI3Z8_04545 [Paludibacteraceae bacterium]
MARSEINTEALRRGLQLSEYRMLKEKALKNQTVIHGDGKDGWLEISAKELFEQLYHEPVTTAY